jgi:hypothetical protein
MAKLKDALKAGSVMGTTCWAFDSWSEPVTVNEVAITSESQLNNADGTVNKSRAALFETALRRVVTGFTKPRVGGKSANLANCIIGLEPGETALGHLSKVRQLYFANKGVLVATWTSPEFNEKWQEKSRCWKDLGDKGRCKKVTL